MSAPRSPNYDIDPIILKRWSARAMSGESISQEELMPLFEAARWAPSSFNNQPWRFIYAQRDSETWPGFLNLLTEGNQSWAKNAAALLIVISRKTFEYNDKPSRTHSFDSGAAWENLALEGCKRGLVVHAMQGFDYEQARVLAQIPKEYSVEVMIAVGKPGPIDKLPEKMQQQEFPNQRRSLQEIVMEGKFTIKA